MAISLGQEVNLAHLAGSLPNPASTYSCDDDTVYWLDTAETYCSSRAQIPEKRRFTYGVNASATKPLELGVVTLKPEKVSGP